MDISKWIGQAKDLGYAALSQASDAIGAGGGFVRSAVGASWLFGSTETSSSYDDDKVDEKHYFLIPDRRPEHGYSLYAMRCLPQGVPPVNDLPKRRLFHLPNAHAMPMVEQILLVDAREAIQTDSTSTESLAARLNDIADQIDQLDGKVFNGVLLIGGLVALINPLAGAAVAVKALIPSAGLLLSKYGLKYVSDTVSASELANRIRTAEREVLLQFRDSGTDSIVNPLLSQLDRALATSEDEYDPLLDFDATAFTFGNRNRDRMFNLTIHAIVNTYEDVLKHPVNCDGSQLGPKDIRYLKMLRQISMASNE